MTVRLDRDSLVLGLRELIARLHEIDAPARIRIVGGAAISLLYNAARGSTVDIDAELAPADVILGASRHIADKHGWPEDWLNDAAMFFLPSGFGSRSAEWIEIFNMRGVIVEVATAETLLAMKLNATLRRGRREADDLTILLPLCGIMSLDDAETLFGDYYAGEEFNARAVAVVEYALTHARAVETPTIPHLGR
ncbi:hypothetical protein [Microbacterium sp. A84]|uniref:hypothetical protein n=1 Tax=Microbacterium sp. A84 TaxID=3450715 RepID=UPI003F428584